MKKHTLSQKLVAVTFLAALALGTAAPAHAGSASASLDIGASVSANCMISAAPLAFGSYDSISANASSAMDGAGSVTVQCTSGASASIMLSQGADADAGSSDDAPLRRLSDGAGSHLSYGLFTDASRSSIWGNSQQSALSHTGTGQSTQLSVYGRVPAGQNVPAGTFTDSVVATVNF